MVKNLLRNGQTKAEILTFLTQLQGMTPEEAESLYKLASN